MSTRRSRSWVPVLAVDGPGLVGMQPQPDLFHAVADRGLHLVGLLLADTSHGGVVDVAFEQDGRELPKSSTHRPASRRPAAAALVATAESSRTDT
jgi:hypothetical protein